MGVHGNGSKRFVILLAILMVAEYISGIVAASLGRSDKTSHGKLNSSAGAKGLLKKGIILLLVALSYGLDWYINRGNAVFLSAVVWFYISNEALSLVENLALCGVPVPKRLRNMLEGLAEKRKSASGA